ncbi:MAG TPA: NnrS family protein [Luteolibacter sp.]|nr:NnrS family protein [Luteolibacter sp.]
MPPEPKSWRSEPYRIFFPLGLLAGIWGVMMWPMLYAGWLKFHPGEAHTRIMIEGFMGAFVIGFIGTAFPRLTDHQVWRVGEWIAILLLWLLTVISHVCGHVGAGDGAFCGALGVLLLSVLSRWLLGRRDTPPPGFVLVLPALAGAIVATWALSRPGLSQIQIQWAKLWLHQAFPLLPLMGIAPYVIPRFFGEDSSHSMETSIRPPGGWWPKALKAVAAGVLIVVSFALEVAGHATIGHLLRAATLLVWFLIECPPLMRRAKLSTTPANACRWALGSMILAWIAAGIWPQARVGSLHLFFASGIALFTLAVGVRVILGHAGRHDLLQGKIVWLRWVIGLLILASTTRMSADLIPKVQVSHYIYAAWSWAIAGALWLIMLARFLMQDDTPRPPKPSKCPKRKNRS